MIHNDDIEACRVPAAQLALLQPFRVKHVIERHGQSISVAERLHYRGLLSFDPHEVFWLSPSQETELDFLCGVAKVIGLRGIDGVLEGLVFPYAYRLSALVYDFSSGRWCLRAVDHREVA